MKVFVWERICHCSDNFHEEGGVVVFAENIERAMAIAIEAGCEFREDEQPNDIRDVDSGKEAIYIMPDAGCC